MKKLLVAVMAKIKKVGHDAPAVKKIVILSVMPAAMNWPVRGAIALTIL